MKRKNIFNFSLSGILFLLFFIFTLFVKFFNIDSVGPNGSKVGFSSLNSFFASQVGFNETYYKITNILGYIVILFAVAFVVWAIVELVKKRSLKKINKLFFILFGFYVVIALFYLFFEVVIVNCRPVILDGNLEASYPSSHTVLALCIMFSSILMFEKLLKNKLLKQSLQTFCLFMVIVIVFGRLFSGVHWLTDILGGVLLSASLLMLFYSFVEFFDDGKTPAIETNEQESKDSVGKEKKQKQKS